MLLGLSLFKNFTSFLSFPPISPALPFYSITFITLYWHEQPCLFILVWHFALGLLLNFNSPLKQKIYIFWTGYLESYSYSFHWGKTVTFSGLPSISRHKSEAYSSCSTKFFYRKLYSEISSEKLIHFYPQPDFLNRACSILKTACNNTIF